jgi:hypothetical protein
VPREVDPEPEALGERQPCRVGARASGSEPSGSGVRRVTTPPGRPLSPAPAPALIGYSVTTPLVVMRPMRSPCCSTNHNAPSGPATMSVGHDSALGSWYRVI